MRKFYGYFLVLEMCFAGALVNVSAAELGKRSGTLSAGRSITRQAAPTYNGGPVMAAPKNVYFIWYGNWQGNTTPAVLTDLVSSLNGSLYFNINTTYQDKDGYVVSNTILFGGSVSDDYSHGTSLSDADIQAIVTRVHPSDNNAIYVVLTSGDVSETSGFGTLYCGWHDHASIDGLDIKYAFVGSPDRQPSCIAQGGISPNNNVMADAMASVLAAELNESSVDPDLDAWIDGAGNESADICAWTFGATHAADNGSQTNVRLGNRDFLLWENWVNVGAGYCNIAYTTETVSQPQMRLSNDGTVWGTYLISNLGFSQETPAGEVAISAGGIGLQMLLDSAGQVWAKKLTGNDGWNGGWTQETPASIHKIAAGGEGLQMVLDNVGQVWAKGAIGNGGWIQETPAGEVAISGGDNGLQMLLDSIGQVWAKSSIGNGGWTQETPPGEVAISAGDNGLQMLLDGVGLVWAKNSIGNGGWIPETLPGYVAISAGGEGLQMMLDSAGQVWAKNSVGNGGWTQETPPEAVAISAGGKDLQMFLDRYGQVWAKHSIGKGGWTQESQLGTTFISAGR